MEPSRRFQAALELHDMGMDMLRLRLKREHPTESDADIRARMRAWLYDRPPDGVGRVVPWPRPRA